MVINSCQFPGFIDSEEGGDECVFNLVRNARIQEGNVQHVVFVEDLPGNTQRFGNKSDRTNAATFPVAPVMHLQRRLEDVLPRHGNGADETGDTAAAFLFGVRGKSWHLTAKFRAGKQYFVGIIHCEQTPLYLL